VKVEDSSSLKGEVLRPTYLQLNTMSRKS